LKEFFVMNVRFIHVNVSGLQGLMQVKKLLFWFYFNVLDLLADGFCFFDDLLLFCLRGHFWIFLWT